MLIYIEYISRRPGIGLHEFHAVAGGGQTGWAGEYDDDITILSVGRSWRIGPEPEYMQVWFTPKSGLERIDFWERAFRAGDAAAFEEPFRLVARIDRAGCYDPILEPVIGTKGRYYAEWFEPTDGATQANLAEWFTARAARYPEHDLNLACLRVGLLGPNPRGLAVWGIDSWEATDSIVREVADSAAPVRLTNASFYADFGQEQL